MSEEEILEAREQLRRHLERPGAFAALSPLGCGRIALYRDAAGTTLGAGHVAPAAAEALVAEGLAAWAGEGVRRRLVAAAAPAVGQALASRVMIVDGVAQAVLVDERESPLLWLHRRPGKDGKPQISATEFAAGERFRADLTLAQMLPRTTMNWDVSLASGDRGSGGRDPAGASDASLAARQRVRQACDRLGPEVSGLAIDVCGFLKGLAQVERERKWPARSAKIMLRLALASLAGHYGLDRQDRPQRRPAAVWRAEDARPAFPRAGPDA